jgi:hypothetical protein
MADTTYIHERADGALVECRRVNTRPGILDLEARVLRPDGRPYDGRWWPVSDSGLLRLQEAGSDIVALLAAL